MWISSFGREDIRFQCLILSTLSQYNSDGKCINFSRWYYVASLL
jgi:hypothetical protein